MLVALPLENIDKIATIAVLTTLLAVNLWIALFARERPVGAGWREHPRLMWSSMAFISLLVLFTAFDLAARYGLIAAQALEAAGAWIAIPAMGLALWVIVEVVRVAYALISGRR